MKTALLITLFASVSALTTDSIFNEDSSENELKIYRARIKIIQSFFQKECSSFNGTQTIGDLQSYRLNDLKQLYASLLKELFECRRASAGAPTSTSLPTKDPATALVSQLEKCKETLNLTESWRRGEFGLQFKPDGPNSEDGYACDAGIGNRWFRFTGLAGTRILNSCPPRSNSCGTRTPYLTDEPMPTQVGVETTIKAYGEENRRCKAHETTLKVMKCLVNNKEFYIYQRTNEEPKKPYTCSMAFCGM